MYKIVAAALVVLSLCVGGLWFSKGMHLATPQEVQVTTESTDEFGDKVTKTEWVKNSDPLDIGLDLAGPIGGILFAAGVGIFVYGKRKEA